MLSGLAVVDSMSNVQFMSFMSRFSHTYLNAYFVGMGFSSLISSNAASTQGNSIEGTWNYESMIMCLITFYLDSVQQISS
ncbi:hypothetical protein KIN20_012580 [Parelaphostrongylus tenuis]|uniref:Riboflavin transporter n=1 Tax=Parelaphostrongylus tenuis TaxID=148309 RepID=A0AAD5MFF3_PARTN|nr:hypothetical protein KIN20_012580 [Parelaphostrongylus tenuis]